MSKYTMAPADAINQTISILKDIISYKLCINWNTNAWSEHNVGFHTWLAIPAKPTYSARVRPNTVDAHSNIHIATSFSHHPPHMPLTVTFLLMFSGAGPQGPSHKGRLPYGSGRGQIKGHKGCCQGLSATDRLTPCGRSQVPTPGGDLVTDQYQTSSQTGLRGGG